LRIGLEFGSEMETSRSVIFKPRARHGRVGVDDLALAAPGRDQALADTVSIFPRDPGVCPMFCVRSG
jgi:hypothetical protein